MSWKCTECGEEFDQTEHRASLCLVDGKFHTVCTHHPEILDRAEIILGSADCTIRYVRKHPKVALPIFLAELREYFREAREKASRN